MRIDFQRPFTAPDDAREVILVRHGSVGLSPVRQDPPIGRQNDPPLSDDGRRQAEAVGERLGDEPIRAVFATPLRRTTETAAPLLAVRQVEAELLPDLREIELGDWEHGELSRRALRDDPEFEAMMRAQRWELIPNAEPAAAFAERVQRGMDSVADTAGSDGVAVAFTHSAVIAEACRLVTHSEPFAFLTVSNASVTRLVRMPDSSWVLVGFNDTTHLPLEWQPRRAGRARH